MAYARPVVATRGSGASPISTGRDGWSHREMRQRFAQPSKLCSATSACGRPWGQKRAKQPAIASSLAAAAERLAAVLRASSSMMWLYSRASRHAPPGARARRCGPSAEGGFPRARGTCSAPDGERQSLALIGVRTARQHAGCGLAALQPSRVTTARRYSTLARLGSDRVARARAWIAANPPRDDAPGIPTRPRLACSNWLAAATLEPSLAPVVRDSLRRGLARVAANVEDDVLGNHVIRNAKALVLGGVAFGDEQLRGARNGGCSLRELPVQVLPDGGHYERSPAYHRAGATGSARATGAYASVDDELEPHGAVRNRDRRDRTAVRRSSTMVVSTWRRGRSAAQPDGDGLDVFADTGYVVPARRGALARVRLRVLRRRRFCRLTRTQTGCRSRSGGRAARSSSILACRPTTPGAERDFFRSTGGALDGGGRQRPVQVVGRVPRGPSARGRVWISADPQSLVGRVRVGKAVEHTRRITVDGRSISVEDEVMGAGDEPIVSTLALAAATASRIDADAPVERVERVLSERLGERHPASALVQRGSATPVWRLRLGDDDDR